MQKAEKQGIEKLQKAIVRIKEYLVHKMPSDAIISDRAAFELLFKKLKRKSMHLFHAQGAPPELLKESKELIDSLGDFFENAQKNILGDFEATIVARSPLLKEATVSSYFSKELVKTILKHLEYHHPAIVLEYPHETSVVLGVFSYCIVVPKITRFHDEAREAFLFELYKAATIVAKEQRPRLFFMSIVIPAALSPFILLMSVIIKDFMPFSQSLSDGGALSSSLTVFMAFFTGLVWVYQKSLSEELETYLVKYLLKQKLPDVALRGVVATLKDFLPSNMCDRSAIMNLLEMHAVDIERDGYSFWKRKAALLSPERRTSGALEHVRYAFQVLKDTQSFECENFYERQALFAYNFLREEHGLPKAAAFEKLDREWLNSIEAGLNEAIVKI